MQFDSRESFQIGDWRVEPDLNLISRKGSANSLRPRAVDLLVYLSVRAGAVVSVDEIIDQVWGGVSVTNGAVYNCINELRDALGDSRDAPQYIETISRRGYRLVARTTGIEAPRTNGTRAVEPSIAVLPFVNMSSDPDQEYFSDGISEELLNVLAQIPNLRVAARMSSFRFKGDNRDIAEIGRRLNVAHVVEGSVRKSGSRIRITAQLIDVGNGFHMWSEAYDRELTDVFAIQDEISAAIVDALKDRLGLRVEEPPRTAVAVNAEAFAAYLRGRYLVLQRTPVAIESAIGEFGKAVALEPDYAIAHAELAQAILLWTRDVYDGFTHSESVDRATPHAERAMALDPALAEAHAAMGFLRWSQQRLEEGLAHFRTATTINPNYSIVYTWMAILLGNDMERYDCTDLGRYDQAFAAHEKALGLDPLSIPALSNYARALIGRNRLEEADRAMENLTAIGPSCRVNKVGARKSLGGKWADAVIADLEAVRIDPEFVGARNYLTWKFAAIGLDQDALSISRTPRSLVLSMLGRPEDAVATAKARLAEEPESIFARRDLGLAFAGSGDYARAGPVLEEMWRRNGERVTAYGLVQNAGAAALIAIRRAAGDDVEDLLAALRDNARRYREAGIVTDGLLFSASYDEGLADFLSGERGRGLALIAKAAEEGYFIWPNEAYLQALYDDPGFAPIRAAQEARQLAERDRFLAAVRADNPYAAVWQPADRHTAAAVGY